MWQPPGMVLCAVNPVGSHNIILTWHVVQSLVNASTSRMSSAASSACERMRVFRWLPFFQWCRRWMPCLVYMLSCQSWEYVFLCIKYTAVRNPKITVPTHPCQFKVAAQRHAAVCSYFHGKTAWPGSAITSCWSAVVCSAAVTTSLSADIGQRLQMVAVQRQDTRQGSCFNRKGGRCLVEPLAEKGNTSAERLHWRDSAMQAECMPGLERGCSALSLGEAIHRDPALVLMQHLHIE